MRHSTSLRLRLVGVIFVAVAPALGMMFATDNLWLGVLGGVMAMVAAWFGWGALFQTQTRALLDAAKRLAAGDLKARTGLADSEGELSELARSIDAMAGSLERQIKNLESAERTLLNRTHQQTVVAALGQFAMASNDFNELLNQAVNFVAQTLELEYCGVLEMHSDGHALTLHAGVGWKDGSVGKATLGAEAGSLINHVFASGEPTVVADLRQEKRFQPPPLFADHGVVSSVNVIISGGTWPYGLLTVGTTVGRKFVEDEVHFLLSVATVLAMAVNRRHNEAQLQKLAAFAQFNPNPVMEFSADGGLTYFNEAAMTMANVLGHEHPREFFPPELTGIVKECLATGKSKVRFETHPGARILSWSFFPVMTERAVHCYVGDITERTSLEAQLRQSQKMESIGQLAAGVAHDFNNMLTIIQGHSGMIMARPNVSQELLDSAQAIYFASERAASLTRQLLVFSRKNVLQPKQLDLKEVVANMNKMLTRLLGEMVELKFHPPAEAMVIQADVGMIEQVIMNLSVNARDAMPRGGTLIINLKAAELDQAYVESHPLARPGKFVCLQSTDTGHGMSAETQLRIFEPFFTTKEAGKGTGLGLATVYGIAKQHEGWIEVESEVGKGTTFHVFFPASTQPVETKPAATSTAFSQVKGGKETILVVEDEPVLRDLAFLILKEQGYRVLGAGSGVEALKVWEKEGDNIDIMVTDMVMPEGMTGKDLAEKLLGMKPKLKVIYASGYSVDDMAKDGGIFLQKPYTRTSLAKTVRETLDS